ncbi:MAG: hypothetical protein M5U15_14385 [Kiritimatiellae bacterium]|nr:hypothetical protein [Kiritimatiellia bacterium]
MKELSDQELTGVLREWKAPGLAADLASGIWARVEAAQPNNKSWLHGAWAFRIAVVLTALLWVAALRMPARTAQGQATDSLTLALAQAGAPR